VALAVAVALAVVSVAGAIAIGVRVLVPHHDRTRSQAALVAEEVQRRDVAKAAADNITAFSTFDYRSLPADEAKAKAVLTPGFGAKYAATFTTLEQTVTQRQATITVSEPLAQTLDLTGPDKATALVFFDQTGRYGDGGATKTTPYRLQMSLVRQNGRWLTDDLEFLQ
jgi:Mce-associated membrane protein